jgi:hypothetical protein
VSRLAPLSLGELVEHWTLRDDEAGLVAREAWRYAGGHAGT